MTVNDSPKTGGGKPDRNKCGKVKVVCAAAAAEVETDQESIGSSEDMDSPRSVAKFRRWTTPEKIGYVHSQILRIREEESHLGEDVGECLNAANSKIVSVTAGGDRHRQVEIRLCSRPILRASPLGGDKTVH